MVNTKYIVQEMKGLKVAVSVYFRGDFHMCSCSYVGIKSSRFSISLEEILTNRILIMYQ